MSRYLYGDTVVFEYKGYKYMPEDDIEEDNVKRFHDVVTPTGERIYVPLGPYNKLTETNFQRWIDLGMPKRGEMGGPKTNWDNKVIESLWVNSKRFIMED